MTAVSLVLLAFLLILFLNYWVFRSVLYPPFIFCAMWCVALSLYAAHVIDVDPLHSRTLLIILTGAAAFSVGGLAAALVPAELFDIRLVPFHSRLHSPAFKKWLLTGLVLALPFLFLQILHLSQQGEGTGMLMRARDALVTASTEGRDVHSFLLDYFFISANLAALVLATEKQDWIFWTTTAIALAGCLLSTGRTNLLQLAGGLIAILLIRNNREQLGSAVRFLKWPVLAFLALFVSLIFIDKDTSSLAGGVTDLIVYFLVSYIVGPMAAFDRVVQNPGDFAVLHGHTFEFFLKLAAVLHLRAFEAPPTLDSFVMVPFPANVYTVFKFYYLELGWAGTVAVMAVLGLLHTSLYRKARTRSTLSLVLFGYSIFPAVMVIFDDWYFSIGSYLRTFLIAVAYLSLMSISVRWRPRAFSLERALSPDIASRG